MKLRTIGFWRSAGEASPSLPDPRDFLDPAWDREARNLVQVYLENGREHLAYMGFSRCRLCGKRVGNAEQTDGVYVWPEGFAHYVDAHSVRPPEEFLEHVWRELDRFDAIERDHSWWASQPSTATARRWTSWRVELAPGASVEDAVWQRFLSRFGDRQERERLERELREQRAAYLSDGWVEEQVVKDLQENGTPCVITREDVDAPEVLLA